MNNRSFSNEGIFFSDILMPTESFLEIFDFLKSNISGLDALSTSNLFRINIFLSQGDSLSNLQISNIKGFSIFCKNENSFSHHLFRVDNGVVIQGEQEVLCGGEFQECSISDLRGIGYYLNDEISPSAIINLMNDIDIEFETDITKQYLSKLLYKTQYITPEIYVEGDDFGPNCSHCGERNRKVSCKWTGKERECPSCIKDILSKTNVDLELGYGELSSEDAHSFRDNFMAESNVGRKYIIYYYVLSDFALAEMPLTINSISDYYEFAIDCYAIKNIIENGSNNKVVVNSNFKEKALAKIEYFKGVTTNIKILTILDDIKLDIINWHGLSKGALLEALN